MSKERISVEVELSTIKSQLRKDKEFSQGIRLYAVYQPLRKKERKMIFGCVCPETGMLVTDTANKGNTVTFFRFLMKAVEAFDGKNCTWCWTICGLQQLLKDFSKGFNGIPTF